MLNDYPEAAGVHQPGGCLTVSVPVPPGPIPTARLIGRLPNQHHVYIEMQVMTSARAKWRTAPQ